MHSQLTTPPSSIAASQSPDNSPNFSGRLQSRHLSPKSYKRQRVPINDNGPLDDKHDVPPRLPPVIRNFSYCVKHAESQFAKYNPHLDLGDDGQENKEIFEKGLSFISIKIVTQAIIVQQAKREWQRVLALATAWEVETDIQRATLSQLVLQQDAIEYARSSAELKFLNKILDRGTQRDSDCEADVEVKRKRYQGEVSDFVAADSQLDRVEGYARRLWQPKTDAPADDTTMEGRLASDSELEFHD